jgi:uncharacterized protein YcfL
MKATILVLIIASLLIVGCASDKIGDSSNAVNTEIIDTENEYNTELPTEDITEQSIVDLDIGILDDIPVSDGIPK